MTPSRFEFTSTPLSGLIVIRRKPIDDERGFLCRFYCADEFRDAGLQKHISQINHTLTRRKGAVRGLHFQYPPHAEAKIVSCISGEIYDIAVDIRRDSPTFLQWHAEILSAENYNSLLIPEGFAHGFQTLTAECEIIYLVTAPYAPYAEGGLSVRDPRLAITWPLSISELSKKDTSWTDITDKFIGI